MGTGYNKSLSFIGFSEKSVSIRQSRGTGVNIGIVKVQSPCSPFLPGGCCLPYPSGSLPKADQSFPPLPISLSLLSFTAQRQMSSLDLET